MATQLRTDAKSLHKRIAIIVAKEIFELRRKQIREYEQGRDGLTLDETRKLKMIFDMLDDTIKTRRVLEGDVRKAIATMRDDELKALSVDPEEPETIVKPSA